MPELEQYLVAALAVRMGLTSVSVALEVLAAPADAGESAWVARRILTPYQKELLIGAAIDEQGAAERDPRRLEDLLAPFRESMERCGVSFPGNGTAVACRVESGGGSAAAPAPECAPRIAGEQALAEASSLHEELGRCAEAWLECARAAEGRGTIAPRERLRQAQERLDAAREQAGAALFRAEAWLREALRRDPGDVEARRRLEEAYALMPLLLSPLEREWARGHFRVLTGELAGAGGAGTRETTGRLKVEAEPAGASVWVAASGSRGWGWGPPPMPPAPGEGGAGEAGGPGSFVGVAPTRELELAAGRYQVFVRGESGEALLPVVVESGGSSTVRVSLRARAAIGEGFVPIPAGPFVAGSPWRPTRGETGEYAMALFPVTFGAYAEFLDALADQEQELEAHMPRSARGEPLCVRDEEGAFQPFLPSRGPVSRAVPVVGVTATSAAAYAAWRSAREVARLRLPTRSEWEKAARGTEGAVYPWGNRFDPALCVTRRAFAGAEWPMPVGRIPWDASPWGVRDLAGNVMEWCADGPPGEDRVHWACGGSWNRGEESALAWGASRFPVDHREEGLGFRLARSMV